MERSCTERSGQKYNLFIIKSSRYNGNYRVMMRSILRKWSRSSCRNELVTGRSYHRTISPKIQFIQNNNIVSSCYSALHYKRNKPSLDDLIRITNPFWRRFRRGDNFISKWSSCEYEPIVDDLITIPSKSNHRVRGRRAHWNSDPVVETILCVIHCRWCLLLIPIVNTLWIMFNSWYRFRYVPSYSPPYY